MKMALGGFFKQDLVFTENIQATVLIGMMPYQFFQMV